MKDFFVFVWDEDYLTDYWSGACIVIARTLDEARQLVLAQHDGAIEDISKDPDRVYPVNVPAVVHDKGGTA